MLLDAMKHIEFLINNGGSYAELCAYGEIFSAELVQAGRADIYRDFQPHKQRLF